MNWRAANEQREDRLRLVFYMFVAMVLMAIRVKLVSRSCEEPLTFFPRNGGAVQDEPLTEKSSLSPALAPHADFSRSVLSLLVLAEIAGRQLVAVVREAYELMKQAGSPALSVRTRPDVGQCAPIAVRLDTS